jgi:hypothetical protein
MTTLFISYHPNDAGILSELLEWLEPFRHKYFLDIYYNRYDPNDEANTNDYTEKRMNAHIYLYLTSTKWVNDLKIQQKEVDEILDRRHDLGAEWVYMLPVQAKPSQWRNFSKLVELENITLPSQKQDLSQISPRELGFKSIVDSLDKIVEPLRLRLIEDAKLKGLPTHGFFTFLPTPKEKAPKKGAVRFTLDDLKRWAVIGLLLFLIYSVYMVACAGPRYGGGYE